MQAYQHVTGNSCANFVSVNTGIIRCFLHEDGDEKKIAAVQAKIDALEAKESWQIEGTHLGKMYEMEINKLKFDRILNESRYQNLSIKDRFSKLL